MQSEPIISVGILSAPSIEFILNGSFTASNGKKYTDAQNVEAVNGKIYFEDELFDELIFEPQSDDFSFDLLDVVIGINFHWERKENQRFKGALKFIVSVETRRASSLQITASSPKLTAINHVKVEDYLTSVISSEMSATASDELLKAHAVISRSWLLHPLQNALVETRRASSPPESNKIPFVVETRRASSPLESTNNPLIETKIALVPLETETRHASSLQQSIKIKWYERDAHAHFDVCADDHCQRYQGITRATTKAVEDAIAATRGEVLMYEDAICDARFSKSCGGVSETFENCWAPISHPYLSKVIDNAQVPEGFEMDLTVEKNAEEWIRHSPSAFCNTNDAKVLSQVLNNYDQETTDFYRWKVEYTQAELSELITRRSGIDFGAIIDLIPVQRGESGRLIQLKIVGVNQTLVVGKELEIRKWLSNSHLYSSAFVIDKSESVNGIPANFSLTGAGWGHGVGLCQIGAAVMGEKGYSYDEILLHYFKAASLQLIY
jgi:SpoIID/LytB domain protein